MFFINVPIGVSPSIGMWRYIRPRAGAAAGMQFDVFGFATLSLAIGALQMLLDRGQQNDWFSSTETWIEVIVAGGHGHVFHRAHAAHRRRTNPSSTTGCSRISNYVTGLLFIFIVGLVLYATRALTPHHAARPCWTIRSPPPAWSRRQPASAPWSPC